MQFAVINRMSNTVISRHEKPINAFAKARKVQPERPSYLPVSVRYYPEGAPRKGECLGDRHGGFPCHLYGGECYYTNSDGDDILFLSIR